MQPLIRAALERRMVINAVMHISFYRWCRLYFQNNLSSPDQILPHELVSFFVDKYHLNVLVVITHTIHSILSILKEETMIEGDAQLKAAQELSKWLAAAANGEKGVIVFELLVEANQSHSLSTPALVSTPLQIMKEAIIAANQRRPSHQILSLPSNETSKASQSSLNALPSVSSDKEGTQTSSIVQATQAQESTSNNNAATPQLQPQPSTDLVSSTTPEHERTPEALLEDHLQYWRVLKEW